MSANLFMIYQINDLVKEPGTIAAARMSTRLKTASW